jgi:hypothetical protein
MNAPISVRGNFGPPEKIVLAARAAAGKVGCLYRRDLNVSRFGISADWGNSLIADGPSLAKV